MTVASRITPICLCLIVLCHAFEPKSFQSRTIRPISTGLHQSSVGGIEGYYIPSPGSNNTSRNVLDSLQFLEHGRQLLEAARGPPAPPFQAADVENQPDVVQFASDNASPQNDTTTPSNTSGNNQSPSNKDDNNKKEPAPGIGGADGTVYDVNRLKRNLVQEMVQKYKQELWEQLGKPVTDYNIVEDKLAALVQSNAVSCTTDSNLLDGVWSFALTTRQSASAMMDPNRFDISTRRTTQPLHSPRVEGPFRSYQRTFFLEDLEEDEDAHVLDHTRYFGGLFSKLRDYNVTRLTRTSLAMQLNYQQWKCLGKQTSKRDFERNHEPMDLRMIYLDSDLCICASNDLGKSPFQVYTKNDAWAGKTPRMKRNMRRVLNEVRRAGSSVWSILTLRKRIWRLIRPAPEQEDLASTDRIIVEVDDKDKMIKVVKLGDLAEDDTAWDGEDDPFVHLSADERQEMLKRMKVRDIDRAARKQQNRKAKKGKRTERRKPFKKPE